MKKFLCFLSAALLFSSCNQSPRPRHVGADDYMAVRGGSSYVGESQEHAFRQHKDGAIIFTDTADLPASEQAKVRAAGKTYTGTGSKVRWH